MINLSDFARGGDRSTEGIFSDKPLATPLPKLVEDSLERKEKENRIPLSEVDNLSRELYWVSSYWFKDTPEFKPDPEFNLSKELFDKYHANVPEYAHSEGLY